jgi:hypothetical protein
MSQILRIVSVLVVLTGCGASSRTKVVDQPAKLEFFVMSQCPYGVQVMSAVAPIVEQLGPNLDFRAYYIGERQGADFVSLHGPNEVKGDLAQVCAQQLAPRTFMKMVLCQNRAPQQVATNWRECAREAGIDVAALSSCIEGDSGKNLLVASFDAARTRGADGSPTMFLNGKPYQGGRRTRDFLAAVCGEYGAKKPDVCTNLPKPPQVAAVFFSDKRCADCNISGLEARLREEVGGLTVRNVDYGTDEGKQLFAKLRGADPSFRFLPAILFEKSIEQDAEGYQALARFLHPVAEFSNLAIGAKFDPTAEICDNKIDDDGNGKIDCQDPSCKDSMICRPERVKTLDLFVMSQCPYGAKAVSAMKEVLANFPADLTLDVHFIGNEQGTELASMHGNAEVEEDVRQACVVKYYGRKHQFMDYLACRAADFKNPVWETCTGKNGIDPLVIKRCYDGEGKALLKESFHLANVLGVDSSPTFLANNRYLFNGIDAETIKQNFCKYNTGLAGCAKKLSGDSTVQGSCGN